MSRKDRSLAAIFGAPLALALASLIGLVGALLADGAADWGGAILLGLCLAPVVWARRRGGRRRTPGAGSTDA